MSTDNKTLNVYNERAHEYADMAVDPQHNTSLSDFISALPKKARVLDYGCGPGDSAKIMAQAGLQVDAFDASPKMVSLASQHAGVSARLMSFDQMVTKNTYHGVWANFSLLHASKSAFPILLEAIHDALLPSGILTLAMKLGTGETRDAIGRYYAYYSQSELTGCLTKAGFTPGNFTLGESVGLAGDSAPFVVMNAVA